MVLFSISKPIKFTNYLKPKKMAAAIKGTARLILPAGKAAPSPQMGTEYF